MIRLVTTSEALALGEALREAILNRDPVETLLTAGALAELDPTCRTLRRELWRLPYRYWRSTRLWMEHVRDTHPNVDVRGGFRALREHWETMRDADFIRRRALGLLF